jgi:hypothetical protein
MKRLVFAFFCVLIANILFAQENLSRTEVGAILREQEAWVQKSIIVDGERRVMDEIQFLTFSYEEDEADKPWRGNMSRYIFRGETLIAEQVGRYMLLDSTGYIIAFFVEGTRIPIWHELIFNIVDGELIVQENGITSVFVPFDLERELPDIQIPEPRFNPGENVAMNM